MRPENYHLRVDVSERSEDLNFIGHQLDHWKVNLCRAVSYDDEYSSRSSRLQYNMTCFRGCSLVHFVMK